MPGLAQPCDGLGPAKDFLYPLPLSLTAGVVLAPVLEMVTGSWVAWRHRVVPHSRERG
jgi:hypothetical protein